MNSPFEDLEYLADFLPEEGESVLMTRRRGQLVCETYIEPASSQAASTASVDRELFGRMTTISARLNQLKTGPILVTVLSYYWMCVLMHRTLNLGWSGWYLDLGLGLLLGVSCYLFVQFRQRKYFLEIVCPLMKQLMQDHQLDKYSLIAYLSQYRNLTTLASAFTRWT
ncbi:MAG: hypothetical protein JKY95_16145 [Planctomycetaceae bacterium]|nr:hypothetical protein [Planctomycetaceae bacterium]